MQRDAAYLEDILTAARLALGYVEGKDLDEFVRDVQCQDATVRRLEIIGEAARRISAETRARHPELPWDEMIGMRNIMVHEYDAVDLTIVWETVRNDLPGLIEKIAGIIKSGGA